MSDRLGPLTGMPLDEVERILREQGLAVEGAHANGVDHVLVTDANRHSEIISVKPVVVWSRGQSEPVTLYLPMR